MRTRKDCFKASGRLRAALLTSSALALAWALPATPARAQDATWGTSPTTNLYGDGSNWNTGSVPSGTAYFGVSSVRYLNIGSNATVGGWTFNVGASDYTITNINGSSLAFTGAGITVNGGSLILNTENSSTTTFQNSSSAGTATIGNQGTMFFANSSTAAGASLSNGNILKFQDSSTAANSVIINNHVMGFVGSSTAGNATITNNSLLDLRDTSTAGSATIITGNGGRTTFNDNSTAGNATITINSGGLLSFYGNSTAGNAAIVNNAGGNIYFSGLGPAGDRKLSVQSLTGAGTSYLDFIELTLGANSQSSEVAGVITGTGSLVKAGSGTLTLSGANSYVGGTTIMAGTLQIGTVTNTGSIVGTVDVRAGTALSLINSNGNGMAVTAQAGSTVDFSNSAGPAGDYRQTVGSIAGAGSYLLGVNELTVGSKNTSTEVSGVISGTGGSLVKIGTGTLNLSATNTYTGSTTVYEGTLQLGTLARTGSVAGAISVAGQGTLDIVNAGAITGITNAGLTSYSNGMSAGSTAITNSGTLEFVDTTTAGSAQITSTGTLYFRNTSSAGNATLTIDHGGTLNFRNSSSAGSSTINNSGTLRFGDFSLSENSTAASAIINNSGTLVFVGSSTGASATINNSGSLTFGYASTAGNAAITNTSANATTSFTGSGPALDGVISVGSIAGEGTFVLNGQWLKVGGNNTSTVVSGTLSIDGTLEKVGTGTLALTGTNAYGGETVVSSGRLQFGDGSAGGSNNLGGNVSVAGGTLAIETPATLTVARTVTFGNNTALSIAAGTNGPALSADSVALGNGVVFNISGITNANQLDKVLINTQSGISGDFAAVIVGGFIGTVDYLTASTRKSADGLQYLASYGLSWTAGNSLAHGTFTLTNASDTFTLGVALTDQAANPATGWNGKSLTKAGAGTLILTGQNTYSGGTTISGGTLQIGNIAVAGAIVGTVTVGAGGTFDLVNAGTSGITGIANSGTTNFRNSSSAGTANITNGGTLNFNDTSTAGAATITNSAAGNVHFNNSSSAGSATIISDNNFLYFNDTSTAGSANITNSANSRVVFQGNATASGATIANNAPLYFYGSSTAGNATITNNDWLSFNETSTAGSATLTNNTWLYFYNSSTAGSATITNSNLVVFRDNSTAGNASIANSNTINFVVGSTAGSATITNNAGGTTSFQDNSTAGNAQLINNAANAAFDFSGSSGPNGDHKLSAGSIAGNGTFYLGPNELTVGGNNLSTTVSGVIADGGASGGTGGSLVKTGTGMLTLSGTNTYTGGTTFAGGTVSVSSDANLGDLAGGLTFNGGTLQIAGTAFNVTARTVNLGAGGGTLDIADAANNFVVSQSISGSTLTKSGAGTLTLTAASFSGATVSAGTLVFDVNATAGNAAITNNAQLVFATSATAGNATITNTNQLTFYGNTTAGNAVINNSGNVLFDGNSTPGSAQLINTASGAVINFFTPGPSSDGKLTAGSIAGNGRFDLNGAELAVGSNNLSTVVTGVLTGDGSITGISLIKVGTGKLALSGVNTYTGATNVDGGTLAVNGSIASSSGVTVNAGGILGGTGIVGNTAIMSGGGLAPGNSIGTLTVSGNLAFAAGSFYTVEVSTTAADRTNVSGTATLTGATVQAAAVPGSFRGQTYTILNATGGFGGTQFAGLSVSGSFSPARNSHLTYDINNVYLVLDPGKIELPAGTSGNQTGVAGGINNAVESGATPPAGFDALLNMSGAQLNRALSEVSGQPGAATTQAAFNAMQQFLAMLDPVGGSMDGERGMSSSPLGYANTAPGDARMREAYAAVTPREASGDVIDQRWGVWASAYGGAGNLSGNAAAGSSITTSRIYGTLVGADYRVSPDTLVGFALGGAGFNFSVADALGDGRADLFQAGLYARHNFGAAYFSAALAYGWQDVTTDRTVTVSGTDKLTANFKASTFAGRLETGWRFAPIPASNFGVTPYGAVQATAFHLPGYGETALVGSNQFALSYTAQDTTNVRTELGMRTDQRFLIENGLLTLRGRLAWAHDTNTNRLVSAAFQTLPGAAFTVSGARPAADSALVGGRAEMKWRNGLSLAGAVEGEFSRSTQTYTGKGTVRYEW